MLDLTRLLIAGLAAYRIAQMVVYDEGPFAVFLRLRVRMGAHDFAANNQPKTSLGKLFACPYCVGVYAAVACTLIALINWVPLNVILCIFAVAGLQSAIEGRTR